VQHGSDIRLAEGNINGGERRVRGALGEDGFGRALRQDDFVRGGSFPEEAEGRVAEVRIEEDPWDITRRS